MRDIFSSEEILFRHSVILRADRGLHALLWREEH